MQACDHPHNIQTEHPEIRGAADYSQPVSCSMWNTGEGKANS